MVIRLINKLLAKHDLSVAESKELADYLLQEADEVTAQQILTLLADKGECSNELLGFHQSLSATAQPVNLSNEFVDIVGTGGDKAGTLNISTGGALLAAACGVPIVKHGNRASSSKCGSADVLAELGFSLELATDQLHVQLARDNFVFLFAPNHYPVLKKLAAVRRMLGRPTIFNLLGPLLNPAGQQHLILGVYKPKYVTIIAEALFKLGTERSLVFHGNGLDELSCLGTINAKLVTREGISDFTIDPLALGLQAASLADLQGADRMYNAQMLIRSLSGIETGVSDSLALNAGAALYLSGRVESLLVGVAQAQQRIKQGDILRLNKLQQIVTRKYQAPQKRKSMKAALLAHEFAVISEIKRASPSAGHIADIGDPLERAREYVSIGAAAISVLTDAGFNGSMADLRRVTEGLSDTPVPVLCKDFMLTPPQIVEAHANGADVILLIVHVLQENTIPMAQFAHAYGLEVLVEVHNPKELTIALQADADVIGVNQRDLNDFSMHPEQFAELIRMIPADKVKVAESGLKTREQALAALALGYDGVLVGEALSRLANPAEFFGVMPSQTVATTTGAE